MVEITEAQKNKKIFTVSPSSLNSVEACAFLFKSTKINRYAPLKTPQPLDRGSLGHFMMHPFYFGQIVNPKEHHLNHPYAPLLSMDRADLIKMSIEIGTLYSLNTDLPAEERENVIEKFAAYCNFYDDDFQVLEVEQPIVKTLNETEEYIIVFEAICDLIVWHRKLAKIVPHDNKWMGRDYTIAKLDHQITGTCWALETDEFRINKVLDRKENPFVREPYSYDKEQIDEWVLDATRTALMAIQYIEAGYYPRNRQSCGKHCVMYEACSTIPSTRPFKLQSAYKINTEKFDIFKRDEEKIRKIVGMIMGKQNA